MFGNYQMWSSFSPLWSSELYVANEDQEWSWLTQAQMAQWHQEDEKWLKARARARVAWEQHAEKVCPACVDTLKSYNHHCPICRAPLAGHVYPEPEEEIEVWLQVVHEDGTVTWDPRR